MSVKLPNKKKRDTQNKSFTSCRSKKTNLHYALNCIYFILCPSVTEFEAPDLCVTELFSLMLSFKTGQLRYRCIC